MDDFEVFISNLASDDPSRNVASIKNAIITWLEAADHDVSIESTDYFNHTYAPDLILRWDRDRSVRPLFLRTSDNPRYIREDVTVVADQRPIIMPLTVLRDSDDSVALKEESSRTSTLVATPGTIGEFSRRSQSPVLDLLSKAVLQGGRGLVDRDAARSASAVVDAGFTAAQHAEVELTRDAVVTAEDLLDPARAGILTRLLHAVWIGSGASAAAFPGATGITSTLDAAGLKLLLEIATSKDPDFWRRIGSGLTLDRLCEIDVSENSASLQCLVNANLDRLRAKALRLVLSEEQLVKLATPRWYLLDGYLGLRGQSYSSLFTPGALSSISSVDTSPSRPVHLPELIERASRHAINVDDVVIESENGRRVEYTSPEGMPIWDDPVLQNLSQALGKGATVSSATIALGDGARHLKCDLQKMASTGRTVAKFSLEELLESALPMLLNLSPQDARALAGLSMVPDQHPIP